MLLLSALRDHDEADHDDQGGLHRDLRATGVVFSDGASLELATVTGDTTNGLTAALTVAV